MGRQRNSEIVPTPRDRTIEEESLLYFNDILLDTKDLEVFYGNGFIIYVDSLDKWMLIPDNDVQLIVARTYSEAIHTVYGLDKYTYKGVTKLGKWMEDEKFFNLLSEFGRRSFIIRGMI